MSPSRSKSKDKKAANKEPMKSSTKPTPTANTSGYNPLLGTFHTLETAPVSSVQPVHVNSRFREIDDSDDPNGNFIGTGFEYDCVSNNGSWSGESEDPKEKPSQGPTSRQETGPGVDNDKREKIRQKNEKKHQRQKERRAQELHERCCGYLMSRKLESLAQQLVAMGFPSERATMALIMNEGKLEESVAWLFESGEEDSGNQKKHNLDNGSNLKVDISQELKQIADMEVKFKCSKQEVERAVVACEGDLQMAAENLVKIQKQESNASTPKPEENGSKPSNLQSKRPLSSGPVSVQQKAEDKDVIYPNVTVTPGGKNIQLLKKVQPNSDWAKPQQAVTNSSVEKKWAVGGLTPSPLQAGPPLSKTETQTQLTSVGIEFKNLQIGSVREPVVMMQRAQSKNIPTVSSSSSSVSHVGDWNFNGVVEPVSGIGHTGMGMAMNPNGLTHRSFNNSPNYGSSNQVYEQFHYQHRQQPPHQHYGLLDHRISQPVATNHLNNNNGMWNRANFTPSNTHTLGSANSLGLFSGGINDSSSGSLSHDWNGEWSSQFDYTNIDWSLNRLPSPASSALRPNGLWMGSGSSPGKGVVRPSVGGMSIGVNRGGVGLGGGGSETSVGGGEWSSPFEEKDLFSLPRQFVSSPSL